MSSDADYASFLEKANQDTGSSDAQAQSSSKSKSSKTVTTNSAVPSQLQELDEYYISETDEPFEPVALSCKGQKSLDKKTFEELISAKNVEELSLKEFDSQGQYKNVLDIVKEVLGHDDIKVFRVESDKSRLEYWVVGLAEDKNQVLGVRAKAVES